MGLHLGKYRRLDSLMTSRSQTNSWDLDNEKFTVNNGAHFMLEKMPHIDWKAALRESSWRTQFILPGIVPEEAMTDLVTPAETITPSNLLSQQLGSLVVEDKVSLPIKSGILMKLIDTS